MNGETPIAEEVRKVNAEISNETNGCVFWLQQQEMFDIRIF